MKTKQNRIGPKMAAVVAYVAEHPGCTKMAAGLAAWDSYKRANWGYIYGPVNRAMKAGLIYSQGGKGNAFALHVWPTEESV